MTKSLMPKNVITLLGKSGQNGFVVSLFFLLFLSFLPTIYEANQGYNIQKGRELVLEHGWTPDFNLYLSKMRQGAEGRWTVIEYYTHEEHQGSLIQIFYLLLGKIGSWFGLSIIATYHLARLVFGASLLILMYLLAVRLFPGSLWALAAFWLSITTSSWPVIKFSEILKGSFWFDSYLSWWTILDPLRRITLIPHLLAGQVLLMTLVYLFFYRLKGRTLKPIVLGLVGLILGFIFPPALLMAYVVVWGTKIILNFKFRILNLKGPFVFSLISFPVFIYLAYITSFYPWKRLNDINIIEPHRFPLHQFGLAGGPSLALAVVGVLIVIWQSFIKPKLVLFGFKHFNRFKTTFVKGSLADERNFWPMAVWLVGLFAIMVVIRQIPTQNALRFTEVAHFVPIGMLAAYALKNISNLKSQISNVLFLLVVGLGLAHMGQSLYWQLAFIHQRVIATLPDVARFPQVMYPWGEFMEAIRWLESNTKKDAIIFSDETFGSYIPPYSGRRVYCCHANTPQKEERLGKVWAFYQGQLGDKDTVYQWLKNLAIDYVMFGPQEKEVASMAKIDDISKVYPFLTDVYQNEKVTIYQVAYGAYLNQHSGK